MLGFPGFLVTNCRAMTATSISLRDTSLRTLDLDLLVAVAKQKWIRLGLGCPAWTEEGVPLSPGSRSMVWLACST